MANNRSAFEAVAGKDALFEYIPQVYPEKSYVERDGLVYKSITGTSPTFISSEWELIADLREVRVPNIESRNALTGVTPTTGTTGIRIPILDNTNVLVLNASDDPQVGVNDFARYNYNQNTASWLLLQVGTGSSSASTTVFYSAVLNKPSIISGVTVNAGGGMSGGGTILGTSSAPYAAGGSVTLSHADTSSQGDQVNSGYAYVQTLRFDTYGHVTGATTNTWVHPTGLTSNFINTGRTYIQSINVTNGHVTSVTSSPWTHPDTSSQGNSVNSGSTFIQSIYLDGDGHVTGINTGVAAGGGGGSYSVNVNGNSGGAITVASGGTINITGGTNITTLRTGNATNAGIRVSVSPAGSNTQLQYNNSGFLGASANLTFNSGTNTLSSNVIRLGSTPTLGTLSDNILIRNTSTGDIERIATSSIISLLTADSGLNKSTATNIRLGGALLQDTTISGGFNLNLTNNAWTFGTRSAGTIGLRSLSVGTTNIASIADAYTFGSDNQITGGGTGPLHFAFGNANKVSSNSSSLNINFAIGRLNSVTGNSFNSGAIGAVVFVGGSNSFGIGSYVDVSGSQALGIGWGDGGSNKKIIAGALNSINISTNTNAQTLGHGALSNQSTILGGINHNIPSGNDRSAIIGGNSIKLTTGYADHVVVPNFAIWSTPVAGAAGTDDVLVWNSTDKKVKKVTQASLSGGGGTPAGANTQIQYNNAGTFGASSLLTFNSITQTLVTPAKTQLGNTAAPTENRLVGGTSSSTSEFRIYPTNGKLILSGSTNLIDSVKIKGNDGASGAGGVKVLAGNSQTGTGGNLNIGGGIGGGIGGSVSITGGTGQSNIGGDITILAGGSTSFSNNRAGNVNITGGANTGSGTGYGGNVTITGGVGKGGIGVDGGAVTIAGSNSTVTGAFGGNVTIKGGNSSTTASSGNVDINGGNNTSTGVAGNINITGGIASTGSVGGSITLLAGTASSGTGGNLVLRGGTGSNGGNVWIEGGLKGAGNSGDIFINDIFNNQANVYLNYGTSFLLNPTTGGKNVMVIGPASTNPTVAPPIGCLLYFDGSTFQLKAWKAGAGAPVVLA